MDALLTPWKLSMLTVLALLCWQGSRGHWPWHKLRTWAALFVTSVGAMLLTPQTGHTPFMTYIVLCIAGGVVLLWPPATDWQKAIGLIFVAMVFFHFGAWATGKAHGGEAYHKMLSIAGWGQFFILLGWSLDDGLGKAFRRFVDLVRRPLARGAAPASYREGQPE